MRIECNGDRVSMSKNEYRQVMNKQNDYKQQRDSLIKDVEKLREEVKSLNRETTKYFEHWQEMISMYEGIKRHIHDKADANPSEWRYIDLVHVIDELEGE